MNISLNFRIADIHIEFDRPTPIRLLATSTFRGLFGYAFKEACPELFDNFFKPGANSDTPPPFAFIPLNNPPSPSDFLDFKIVTFDTSGEVISAFDYAAKFCEGREFGSSGSKIKKCDFAPGSWNEPTIPELAPRKISINFVSPVSFKYNKKKVLPKDITLPLIIYGIYNSINKLCRFYAVDDQNSSLPKWPDLLGNSFVQKNNLEWVSPKRYSASQNLPLTLSGIVGDIIITTPTKTLLTLLNIVALMGLGKNTVHGCGRITWNVVD